VVWNEITIPHIQIRHPISSFVKMKYPTPKRHKEIPTCPQINTALLEK
jgi:hypothetical protein